MVLATVAIVIGNGSCRSYSLLACNEKWGEPGTNLTYVSDVGTERGWGGRKGLIVCGCTGAQKSRRRKGNIFLSQKGPLILSNMLCSCEVTYCSFSILHIPKVARFGAWEWVHIVPSG